MSEPASRASGSRDEIEELRLAVAQLAVRIEEHEEQIQLLRGPRIIETPSEATTPFETVAPELEGTASPSWAFREEVAREIGGFLRRALDGDHRGASGRGRLPNLANRVYLVCKDIEGNLCNPVRVEDRFHRVRALCQRGDNFGDSVFIGVPSRREGRIAAQAAGLRWPDASR